MIEDRTKWNSQTCEIHKLLCMWKYPDLHTVFNNYILMGVILPWFASLNHIFSYGLFMECLWFFQAILAKCSGLVPEGSKRGQFISQFLNWNHLNYRQPQHINTSKYTQHNCTENAILRHNCHWSIFFHIQGWQFLQAYHLLIWCPVILNQLYCNNSGLKTKY